MTLSRIHPCTAVPQLPPHETALMYASQRGHHGVVVDLLSYGADVNAVDEVGRLSVVF